MYSVGKEVVIFKYRGVCMRNEVMVTPIRFNLFFILYIEISNTTMFLAFQHSCQPELNVNYKQNIGNWLPIQHKLWDLMKKTVWFSRSSQASNSGLIWDTLQENVQLCLNMSTLWLSMFLNSTGSKLKILAPLTPREDSLAFLTGAGEDDTTSCGRSVLPRRPPVLVNRTWYLLTMPWEIFQRKSIMYLSLLRSWENIFMFLSFSQ